MPSFTMSGDTHVINGTGAGVLKTILVGMEVVIGKCFTYWWTLDLTNITTFTTNGTSIQLVE